MTRVLIVSCVLLAVVCAFQWRALRSLKTHLATVETRAYQNALVDRRDELARALTWLDTYSRSADGMNRPQGLCGDGRLDVAAIDAWMFDTYLRERSRGASEIQAREAVVRATRASSAPPPSR